jgi:ABC-type multidrug transport system fused ATPase/permease subunit
VAPLIAGTLCIGAIAYVGSEYSDTSPIKLISFFYVFLRISQLLSQAINNYTSLKLNMPSVRLLFDLYEIEKKIDGREQLNSKTKKPENAPTLDFKKLEVRNLAFGYNKDSLISGVDLNVLAGDFVLIKGESGSGKSTFLKLVLGLITPTSGEIKVNETPLLNMKWDFLETIGYVGPENNLIQGTIRDNLLYGLKRSVSESEIHEALSHAKILQKIKSLPNGLDTVLSEKIELSSGQQQRIALARALVRKPSILILDEATSNLDIETESEFLDSIHQLNLSKITVIAVSHRATYDRFANRTFTCKMGKITESH